MYQSFILFIFLRSSGSTYEFDLIFQITRTLYFGQKLVIPSENVTQGIFFSLNLHVHILENLHCCPW